MAPAIAGVLWIFMFHPSLGMLARGLRALGIDWNPLLNGNQAMILVVLAAAWKQISYNFLFFLAGLQAIPKSVIEAAAIDGAGPMRRFWTIVFPLLSPTIFFLLVVNIVYAFFDTFGIIDAMTARRPGQGDRDPRLQGLSRRPARRQPRRLGGAVGDPDGHRHRADGDPVPLRRAQGDSTDGRATAPASATSRPARSSCGWASLVVAFPVYLAFVALDPGRRHRSPTAQMPLLPGGHSSRTITGRIFVGTSALDPRAGRH